MCRGVELAARAKQGHRTGLCVRSRGTEQGCACEAGAQKSAERALEVAEAHLASARDLEA